jgi:hypothetical protein
MGVTNYATINGVLVGENGPNGTMYYHTDALGSVTMTSDQNGSVLNEYRYKPFGTVKTRTGTAPDPKFLWVGSLGYRQTGGLYSDAYVRARHFRYLQGAWTGVDRLWPRQSAFSYGYASPVKVVDPTGLAGCCVNANSFKVTTDKNWQGSIMGKDGKPTNNIGIKITFSFNIVWTPPKGNCLGDWQFTFNETGTLNETPTSSEVTAMPLTGLETSIGEGLQNCITLLSTKEQFGTENCIAGGPITCTMIDYFSAPINPDIDIVMTNKQYSVLQDFPKSAPCPNYKYSPPCTMMMSLSIKKGSSTAVRNISPATC